MNYSHLHIDPIMIKLKGFIHCLFISVLSILLISCSENKKTKILKSSPKEKNTLSVRNAHSMVYNNDKERVYLFGGADEKEVKSDLWFLNNDTWKKISVSTSPEARTFASMVYDKHNKRIVLFGGSKILFGNEATKENLLNDTWQYKGNKWTKIESENTPIARAEASIVYNEENKTIVLFGGYTIENENYIKLGDTWEFRNNDWHLVTRTGPSARHGAPMVYDSQNKYIVLFGGSTIDKQYGNSSGETWIYNDKKWMKLDINQPNGIFNASMIYDKLSDKLIRFGGWNGNNRINETWVLTNNEWKKSLTETQPTSRNHSGMVYDESLKKIVLFGGHDGDNIFGDLWVFDKKGWKNIFETKPIERIKNGH